MTGLYAAVLGADAAASPDGPGLLRRVRHRDASFTIDTSDEVGLVLTLSEAHRVERRMEGRISRDAPRVGAITLLPPGCPAHFTITGPASVLMLRVPWQGAVSLLAQDHGADPVRIEFRPRFHADDPVLARLLYGAAASGVYGGEEAVHAILARLLTDHAARPARPGTMLPRGGLAPARLRRVLDRIESGLAGRLTLSALAAEAGMTPFHFAHEFRRVVGSAPHQYLVRRRVDRAVVLLGRRELTVAEVARQAGFTHASHLARHMRRQTGMTADAFRADVLP